MSVVDAAQPKAIEHGAEVAHVSRQTLRRDGRILDNADGLGVAFHAAEHAQAGLSQGPDARDIGSVHPRAGV